IDQHNHYKAGGKRIASNKTKDDRAKSLFLCFRTLREKLGYSIDNPANLKPKHIEALVRYWESAGLSASTIQTRLSFLRTFAEWIGKPGMITASVNYVANPDSAKRTYSADRDKGWTANRIDVESKLQLIALEDPYVGMQLKVASIFGLRRKEAVMFAPYLADHQDILVVERGAKGGRPRVVMIDSPKKRAVVEEAKVFVMAHGGGRLGHLGEPGKNLEQNLARFSNTMSKHGLTRKEAGTTAHGLRHQFACDRLAEQGVVAPVRGGQPDQVNREDRAVAYRKVSEELGHSRQSVMAAYAGRFIRTRK
ncbi:MAG: integrase domain-containing protein, partial [Sterolibacterium sp.]